MLAKQLAAVEAKVNQILELIKASETLVRAIPIVGDESVSEIALKTKVRKPKKITPAIKKAAAKKKVTGAKKIAKKSAKK